MAKKKKIVLYDESLKSYKEYTFTSTQITVMLVVFVLFISTSMFILGHFVFTQSNALRIKKLKAANQVLWNSINKLSSELNNFERKFREIVNKEEQLRLALNLPEISPEIREVGFGGASLVKGIEDYENLFEKDKFNNFKDLLVRVEKLNKELDFETKNFRNLIYAFKAKEDSIRYIPCIKPVPRAPITSRFGRRLHPILKVIRMHDGVDMLANKGTPIYAPADGVVKFAGRNGTYGNFVVIDHLKGFLTKYGHLSKIDVKIGQKVRRGEKIGEVGNTGLSTAPHLHYEVVYKGRNLDPAQFMIE